MTFFAVFMRNKIKFRGTNLQDLAKFHYISQDLISRLRVKIDK